MAFIGNTNTTQAFTPAVDFFSGNGSTVAFTLSRPVASVAQVQVNVANVPQVPGTAYTVSGNTITFTSAPPTGTNNIYVYYTSPITQVIAPGQGTVTTSSLASSTGSGAVVLSTSPTLTTPLTTTTIGVGNATPSASGAGITFPATQSASTDANTLDDYEEGTWTPILGGSGGTSGQTYNYRQGNYTKVGNVVTCECIIQLTAKGTITTNLQLQGIPFVIKGYPSTTLAYHYQWTATAGNTISISGNDGDTFFTFWQADVAGGASAILTTTAIGNTSQMALAFSYLTT
jgi:hypothetical protein